MKRAALLALLLLGCKQQAAPDGYAFASAEYVQTEIALRVVLVPTQAELRRIAPRTVENPENLMAFGRISSDHKTCTVYMVDARTHYQPQWMGHEFAHCVYGRWHP